MHKRQKALAGDLDKNTNGKINFKNIKISRCPLFHQTLANEAMTKNVDTRASGGTITKPQFRLAGKLDIFIMGEKLVYKLNFPKHQMCSETKKCMNNSQE